MRGHETVRGVPGVAPDGQPRQPTRSRPRPLLLATKPTRSRALAPIWHTLRRTPVRTGLEVSTGPQLDGILSAEHALRLPITVSPATGPRRETAIEPHTPLNRLVALVAPRTRLAQLVDTDRRAPPSLAAFGFAAKGSLLCALARARVGVSPCSRGSPLVPQQRQEVAVSAEDGPTPVVIRPTVATKALDQTTIDSPPRTLLETERTKERTTRLSPCEPDKTSLLRPVPVPTRSLQVPEEPILLPTTTADTRLVLPVPSQRLVPTRPSQVEKGESRCTSNPIGLAQGLDVGRAVQVAMTCGSLVARAKRGRPIGPTTRAVPAAMAC